jgi:hypothetical protein
MHLKYLPKILYEITLDVIVNNEDEKLYNNTE